MNARQLGTALILGFSLSFAALRPARSAEPGTGVFFVATNGNDQWTGTLPQKAPGEGRDGPFATVARAVQALREAKGKSGGTVTNGMIHVAGGTYYCSAPLVLVAEDSHLRIDSAPQETATLSGGKPLSGWRETTLNGGKAWVLDVPLLDGKPWTFHELWVNGQRAVRARFPKHGYLEVVDLPDKAPEWTKGQNRFKFKDGCLHASATITNAEVVVMDRWVESRLPIQGVNEAQSLVSFTKKSVFALEKGDPYYVEGAPEFLQDPGEWCLNLSEQRLYYKPRPNETMAATIAVAPVLAQVVRFEGTRERPVADVRFDGVTFSHAEWCFPAGFLEGEHRPVIDPAPAPDIGGFAQAAVGVPGAVWGVHAHGCGFVRCHFENLGTYALELARGCQSNRVADCVFRTLGAGGVKLGETAIRDVAEDVARCNEVTGCEIADGGLTFHSAIGVWIGQSPANRLVRNHIHDFYYTGISIGWTWGYGNALASNNVVELNHVHHVGVKANGDGPILSDMGGIYTLGKQPGTVIRNNLWHDMAGLRYGGWGIYFDEGSSGILAESNIVYRTTHGGFHQHYGETNLLRNNIFAFARDQQVQRSRPENHTSFTFSHNIVVFDSGVVFGGDLSNDHYDIDHNLYFDARPGAKPDTLPIGPCSLAQWRVRGHDRDSIVADPLFASPQTGDFSFKPGSPALKMGFQPIQLREAGVPGM